jgi:hypothetical protein
MASNPLFGVDIAAIVASAVGPGVLDATLIRVTAGSRGANSTGGTTPTSTNYACKGFIDSKDRESVGGTLVKDGDVVIILIGNTISGGSIVPETNDKITIEGATYVVYGLDRDPAAATYTLVSHRVSG